MFFFCRGWLTNLEVPTWLRGAVYGAYGTMFNVVWDEVEKPLVEYKSLADFFTRNLVIGARPLDNNDMVCPVDGKVLHFGEVVNDQWMEQVKGIKYTMEQFMGSDAKTAIADIRFVF
jgi:phosphatidylserine decarboxylase